MPYLLSRIMTLIAFILIIVILFRDESDYLFYSFIALLIAAIPTAIEIPEASSLEVYIEAIDWNVIIFLIFMFTIVAILNDAKVFHEIARRIVKRYKNNVRKMFYMICIISTLSAAIIEDLSVAIIFIPIIIYAAEEMDINPSPFLLGMTICINLASTLTPFGSAQNIMIAHYFDLNAIFFIVEFGPYFVVTTLLTLFLVDRLILTKTLKQDWEGMCMDDEDGATEKLELKENESKSDTSIYSMGSSKPRSIVSDSAKEVDVSENIDLKEKILIHIKNLKKHEPYLSVPIKDLEIRDLRGEKRKFYRNLVGLFVFVVLLLTIHSLYIVGILGVIIFTALNPVESKSGKKRPNVSYYLSKVDYKLLYFFIVLFILVHLMEINGLINLIKDLLEKTPIDSIFWLSIIILVLTSLLSGFLDNAPVTIIFLPIISLLTEDLGTSSFVPLIIAFVLGINLGGNFLPQGSAADMMTLELAEKHCVRDLTYKRLVKVGGLFALLHLLVGVVYIAFIVYVF